MLPPVTGSLGSVVMGGCTATIVVGGVGTGYALATPENPTTESTAADVAINIFLMAYTFPVFRRATATSRRCEPERRQCTRITRCGKEGLRES